MRVHVRRCVRRWGAAPRGRLCARVGVQRHNLCGAAARAPVGRVRQEATPAWCDVVCLLVQALLRAKDTEIQLGRPAGCAVICNLPHDPTHMWCHAMMSSDPMAAGPAEGKGR